MPNTDFRRGLRSIQRDADVAEYWAEVNTALAVGDAVRLNTNGRIIPAGAGQPILGSLESIQDVDGVPISKLPSSNSDMNLICMVADQVDNRFVIQMDDTDVSVDSTGQNADIAYGSADALRDMSTTVIDGSTVGTGTQLRLLRRFPAIDNEYAPYCDWEVKINKHQMYEGTVTTYRVTEKDKAKAKAAKKAA